ncbi:unnamed protein product [Blepharisma stoltei]|uniref:F-box domain-containing protein n=1 Tax=Blepharisma stoltei TaxID=1481888 RepID=A0AAU9JKA6_9CILI|nr:unnamed protein product [Blepharisma stoltei]
MLPQPLIFEIVSYLSLPDLFTMAQVNKSFNKAAETPSLWKREFLKIWIQDDGLNSQLDYNTHRYWKQLCIKGLKSQNNWKKLPGRLFTHAEISLLYNELQGVLKSPAIPIISFRRDINTFPTLLQDIFGNPQDQHSEDMDIDTIQTFEDYLNSAGNCLCAEIRNASDLTLLAASRWNLISTDAICEERPSDSSESTCDTDEEVSCKFSYKSTKSFLLEFYICLKKSIELFCEGISYFLLESNDILNDYLQVWNNFAASAKNANELFYPLVEMINEVYEAKFGEVLDAPRMSLIRMMIAGWRRIVFERVQEKLISQIVKMIESVRKLIFEGKVDYLAVDSLKSIVDAIMDISLNELTVYFKSHSKLQLEGPYLALHEEILAASFDSYSELALQPLDLAVFFEKESNLLFSFLPNSTICMLNELKIKILINNLQKSLSKEFLLFNQAPFAASQKYNSNEITAFLYAIDPNPSKISSFLDFCFGNEKLVKITQMLEFLSKNPYDETIIEEDLIIERRATLAGIPINIQPEKLFLFSTCQDLTYPQLKNILKAYAV